jgi:hypothetical protein
MNLLFGFQFRLGVACIGFAPNCLLASFPGAGVEGVSDLDRLMSFAVPVRILCHPDSVIPAALSME